MNPINYLEAWLPRYDQPEIAMSRRKLEESSIYCLEGLSDSTRQNWLGGCQLLTMRRAFSFQDTRDKMASITDSS